MSPLKLKLINFFQQSLDSGINYFLFEEAVAERITKPKKHSTFTTEFKPITKTKSREEIKNENFNLLFNEMKNNQNTPQTSKTDTSIIEQFKDLNQLQTHLQTCMNCELGITRLKLVFGSGSQSPDIVVIGEAPGEEEDESGLPFVGRAGKLLTDILASIKINRDDVYITNICKCRPPANRKPTNNEINQCEPFLIKQLELLKPQFILAFGLTAAEALFNKKQNLGEYRGKIWDYNGTKTFVTYHPAALLRNPN